MKLLFKGTLKEWAEFYRIAGPKLNLGDLAWLMEKRHD